MKFIPAPLPGVVLIETLKHGDRRGFFMETWREDLFAAEGLPIRFVQDNASRSVKNTLRGLHYQHPHGQGKLVRVVSGRVFDVAVDIRRGSPHFGKWFGCELSDENALQMYVPPGFAHGYLVLSDTADFAYKCTEYYHPETEGTILWNDPFLGIDWPIEGEPLLSDKDRKGLPLCEADNLPDVETG
ncbi:MAG: dTDP-4-dehydrorhamnose 3,5-epimerase [Bacteroidota bacterium]|nr:dTDP-4-dehydrorhamnose 3,5-epimerase [Bacteroidota bacterium]